jgi:hypothetical protein
MAGLLVGPVLVTRCLKRDRCVANAVPWRSRAQQCIMLEFSKFGPGLLSGRG